MPSALCFALPPDVSVSDLAPYFRRKPPFQHQLPRAILLQVNAKAANEAREYARGWEQTGRILEELKRAELRKMTEADAAKIFTELDYPLPSPWHSESKPEDNGLVEQQRWFMKAHAHRSCS